MSLASAKEGKQGSRILTGKIKLHAQTISMENVAGDLIAGTDINMECYIIISIFVIV